MPDQSNSLIDEFLKHDRVVIEATLKLASGSFFQPTGFPDIGACVFVDKDGRRRCLVESEQSMANRLESVCMQAPGVWRPPFVDKLPIIRVVDGSGNLLATNLTEPHRLSSSYVLEGTIENGNGKLQDKLRDKLGISTDGKRWPLDKRGDLSQIVFALDPAALLYGFQFMQWSAVGLRQQRLLHARMEAVLAGDSDVYYGMVKVDAIEPESSAQKMGNKGQSIAQKSRFVPESINATFELDLLGLRERRLIKADTNTNDHGAHRFLLALAVWTIHQFLSDQPAFDARTGQVERSLRLRSDCALRCSNIVYRTQSNGGDFSDDSPLELKWLVKIADRQNGKKSEPLVEPLAEPPDFTILHDQIFDPDPDGTIPPSGTEAPRGSKLEITVKYEPAAATPANTQTTLPSGENGEENDEDQ